MTFTLEQLNARVAERAFAPPELSYTATLLEDGVERCARKFGEEAVEAIIAAVSKDKHAVIAETADVLFHLLVMLKSADVTLDEVMAELDKRTTRSGHEEKAARKPAGKAKGKSK
jgi:phosphoribosyl-ATP pyrophosphohydrolase